TGVVKVTAIPVVAVVLAAMEAGHARVGGSATTGGGGGGVGAVGVLPHAPATNIRATKHVTPGILANRMIEDRF
ncbi:MAG: hypothetical protein Q8N52_13560, partial [Acidobacteriota bacterium]|nr:hypothetical protein [Acidobacteriota bacterium]